MHITHKQVSLHIIFQPRMLGTAMHTHAHRRILAHKPCRRFRGMKRTKRAYALRTAPELISILLRSSQYINTSFWCIKQTKHACTPRTAPEPPVITSSHQVMIAMYHANQACICAQDGTCADCSRPSTCGCVHHITCLMHQANKSMSMRSGKNPELLESPLSVVSCIN